MKSKDKKNADLFIFLALLFQFLVLILRVIASLIWNNYALLIESFHIGIDIAITVLVIISLKISRSAIRNRYSYGLYKMEDIISLFIAVIVAFSAYDIVISSFGHYPSGDLQSSILQILSLIPLYLAGRMKIIGAGIIKSPSLKSDGFHTYTDVYEGLGVAAGLLLNFVTNNIIFYYAAITIAAVTLFYTSYEIGKGSIESLLDLPKDKSITKKIEDIINENKNVNGIKSVKLRWAGPVIFAEVVMTLNSDITIGDAHIIADDIERNIYEKLPEIKDIIIHIEPSAKGGMRVVIPIDGDKIDLKFARAGSYEILEIEESGKIMSQKTFQIKVLNEKKNAQRIQKMLLENSVTDVIAMNIGDIARALIKEKGIKVWKAVSLNPKENIDLLIKGKLVQL